LGILPFNANFFFDYTKETYLQTLLRASELPSSPRHCGVPHNAIELYILIQVIRNITLKTANFFLTLSGSSESVNFHV